MPRPCTCTPQFRLGKFCDHSDTIFVFYSSWVGNSRIHKGSETVLGLQNKEKTTLQYYNFYCLMALQWQNLILTFCKITSQTKLVFSKTVLLLSSTLLITNKNPMAGKIKYFPGHLYNSVLWYELITWVMTEQLMYKNTVI